MRENILKLLPAGGMDYRMIQHEFTSAPEHYRPYTAWIWRGFLAVGFAAVGLLFWFAA